VSGIVFRLQITLQSEQITQECPAEKSPRQFVTKLTLTMHRHEYLLLALRCLGGMPLEWPTGQWPHYGKSENLLNGKLGW
jgi:hypothetical protein